MQLAELLTYKIAMLLFVSMTLTEFLAQPGQSQIALAKALGVHQTAVSQWIAGKVPLDRCVQIEKLTNAAVTCEDLRPDQAEYFAYLRGVAEKSE